MEQAAGLGPFVMPPDLLEIAIKNPSAFAEKNVICTYRIRYSLSADARSIRKAFGVRRKTPASLKDRFKWRLLDLIDHGKPRVVSFDHEYGSAGIRGENQATRREAFIGAAYSFVIDNCKPAVTPKHTVGNSLRIRTEHGC